MIPRTDNFQAFANRGSSANLAVQAVFQESELVNYCKIMKLVRIPATAVADIAR